MLTFPNAKINIGLTITGKREDGFHELQTIFYPVAINDALEVIDSGKKTGVDFSSSGIGMGEDKNICIRAYEQLQKGYNIPGIQMHLHKAIPVGGGLGGGSSDAAFTLQLLNKKYSLGLSAEVLAGYAAQLGSDCVFFLTNKPCFATGRGEILKEITLDLSAYNIVVINPGIHIGTKWAFSQLNLRDRNTVNLKELISQPVSKWKNFITNDFEEPVFTAYPEIRTVKQELYDKGAVYASLSGSGSSVYGIFDKGVQPSLDFPDGYFVKWI